MFPRATMRPQLLNLVLLLAVTATVPLASAVCVLRHEKLESSEKPESKIEAAAATRRKTLSLDEYGPPKKVVEKPKEVNPYEKPVKEAEGDNWVSYDKYVESLAPKKVKKAKSDDSDASEKLESSEKPESKIEAAAATRRKTLSLDEYGPPKKVVEKPKEVNSYEKPVKEVEGDNWVSYDKYVESLAPKKVKKEKSDDSDASGYLKKQKKSDDSDKKEKKKSDDLDDSSSAKKEKKEKSDDSDAFAYLKKKKKEKKEKSDDSDDSSSSSKTKKEKKEKSDDESSSSSKTKKEKKKKSDNSDESSSSKKQKKSDDSDEDASSKKEKKEKAKKKVKSDDYSSMEEKPDEDAAPVDVSNSGEYVSPKEAKSNEDATTTFGDSQPMSAPDELPPVTKSSTTYDGAMGSPDELPPLAKSSAASDHASSQPMGGATDELPPVAKSSTTYDAMGSPDELPPSAKSSSTYDAMGSPDELPPSAKSSAAASDASSQPMGGSPGELPPSVKSSGAAYPYASASPSEPGKPKLSMESFDGMIKPHPHPFAGMLKLNPMIQRVCDRTTFPYDCEASIGGLPGGAPPQTDAVGVLRLAMQAVRQKATEAMNAATDRMNAAKDPLTKEALDDCSNSYSDLRSNLDTVEEALKRGDIDTARTNLDSVETDVTTCDDGFNERGKPSVMTDHDQELQKLASDLIAIGATSIKRY